MPANDSQCRVIEDFMNATLLPDGFKGIPHNLFMNSVISMLILLVFIVMKAIAWNRRNRRLETYQLGWISLLYRDVFDFIPKLDLERMGSKYRPLDPNMTFCQMMWYSFFKITNNAILERCGMDGIEYFNFLQIMIEYSAIDTLFMLVCILPANYQGDMISNPNPFVKTTMGHLDFGNTYLLWVHFIVAFFLTGVCLIKVRNFSAGLVVYHNSAWTERTVLLKQTRNWPITSERIEKFIKDAFPTAEIEDIKLVYKYKRLIHLNRSLKDAEEALNMCRLICVQEHRRVYVKEKCCFCHTFCWSTYPPCSLHTVDGITYYTNQVDCLKKLVAAELNILSSKILRFVFVTFQNESSSYQARANRQKLADVEDAKHWTIQSAPDPANIIWENLSRREFNLKYKTLFINSAVFLVAIFLTTPAIVLSSSAFEIVKKQLQSHGLVISRFVPTVIVWILSISIPALVTYSSGFMDFETKSDMNRSIMLKTVIFLIFVVVLLPSLGLTSISAFVIWSIMEGRSDYQWGCIFLPDNGSFFVGYVITSSFIGNIIQFLRLPDLFFAAVGIITSKSEAERLIIRKSIIWDFMYGVQYAHGLLIFTLVMFYSLPCPVIAPFGLMYFILKFFVDRYNMYFACRPSRTSYRVHSLALQFMMFAVIMKNVGLFFLVYIRSGWRSVTYAFNALVWLTILLCVSSMNPCNFLFIPPYLLMPHQINFKKYCDCYEQKTDMSEQQTYHPFALRKYINMLVLVDKYENPLQPRREVSVVERPSIDLQDDTLETFCTKD